MTSINIQGVIDQLDAGKEKYSKALVSAGEVFTDAYKIFNDPDFKHRKGWKVEVNQPKIKIHSKQFSFGNVFAVSTVASITPDLLLEESFDNFENATIWNPNMSYAKIFAKLTDHVDIIHYTNPSAMMIKSRESVAVRIWRKTGNEIYVGGKSVDLDEIPETKNHIRAKINLACGKYIPDKFDPSKTHIEYIMSIDLNGSIPKCLINAIMGKMIAKDFELTTKHFEEVMTKNRNQ